MEEPAIPAIRRAPVRTDPFRCLRVRHYLSSCSVCSEACPRQAIALGPGPAVDAARCNGCGVCAAVCPTEALELRGLGVGTVVEAADRETEFSCLHASGGRGMQVPCLGFLDAGALLAVAVRAKQVTLESGPCAACPEAAGLASAQHAATVANAILAHYGAEGRIAFKQTRAYVAGTSLSRRHLFGFLRRKAQERLEPDPDAPITPSEKGTASRGALRPRRRALLVEAMGTLQAGDARSPAGGPQDDSAQPLPFFALAMDEACDNCGMCLTFCPTAALRQERADGKSTFTFNSDFCLGCGLCVKVCPKGVVRMERLVAPSAVGTASALLVREVRRCANCGSDFPAVEGERLCRPCSQKRSFDAAIRRTLFGTQETNHR